MNKVIVIWGASGTGKSYWKKYFVENGLNPIISLTTRKMREDEQNENEYLFVTNEEFKRFKRLGDLFNINKYQNKYYGSRVVDLIKSGHLVMISDVTNLQMTKKYLIMKQKEPILVYIVPPSENELNERHKKRKTKARIKVAQQEITTFPQELIDKSYKINNKQDADKLINMIMK